jgi:alpha-L-fucosidase
MKQIFYALTVTLLCVSCAVNEPAGFGVLPTEEQVEWQKNEYTMFVHFGPNTFTGVEWGSGQEKAEIFNPTSLDCRQWASIAKAAGMKGIILTAKHHDGFCLWPNPVSSHTVAQSSWKDGKGDVLKELSDACREYDLGFGIYISPWDRNDPHYGTDEYNDVFVRTLEHALGSYGHVFEQWFDRACGEGPNGKRQVYDWPLFNSTVHKMQPDAVIFSDYGPGCRWVGNEAGHAGRTCWSTINVNQDFTGPRQSRKDLNEGIKGGNTWAAAESDVSIRPGWFWRESENSRVKSLQHLLKIYYETVGRNSLLLLNVPADDRGLIHEVDSMRLMQLRAALEDIFSVDLSEGAQVEADNVRGNSRRFRAQNLLDKDYDRYWATDDEVTKTSFIVRLPEARTFNRVQIQEYIPLGQRVSAFSIDAMDEDGSWRPIAKETTIGYKRIVHVPTTTTAAVRVNIDESEACPVLNGFALFMDNVYTSIEMSNVPSGEVKPVAEPLVADLGSITPIRGFVYAPKVDGEGGVIVDYRVEISDDGNTWTPISPRLTFDNIVNNPISQEKTFSQYIETRYLRLIPDRAVDTDSNEGVESMTYGVSVFACIQ